MHSFIKPTILGLTALSLGLSVTQAVHPSRGLWVGEVALNAVNEATGAVGDSNTYEFTDPEITTPTSDSAYLRLIVHVNAAGQAFLLKSVAVVDVGELANGNRDLVLLTNPDLYPNYPGVAKRVASAFYDFGDTQAVNAVQTIIDTVTQTAATRALAGDNESTIRALLESNLGVIVDEADVDLAYLDRSTGGSSFLTDSFFSEAEVEAIADAVAAEIVAMTKTVADYQHDPANPVSYAPFSSDPLSGDFATTVGIAEALRDSSVYEDTRGIAAIVNVVVAAAEAAASAASGEEPAAARAAARAARHNAADVNQAYNQFIASTAFIGLLTDVAARDAAVLAAIDANDRGRTQSEIETAVTDALVAAPAFQDVYTDAETINSASLWGDTRAREVLDALVASAASAAAAQVLVNDDSALLAKAVTDALEDAFDEVEAGPVFTRAPSSAYTEFVRGSSYQTAATQAAQTAASEAFFRYSNGVTDEDDLKFFINRAVSQRLIAVRNQAAALLKTEVALNGVLEAEGSLSGEFILPALAPTNPFLHRLHPDHTEGIAITRRIELTVDSVADASGFESAGFGVSSLSGTYEEEIFGLHKALGSSQDIGLKTAGRFTLNRLTLVDTLNF